MATLDNLADRHERLRRRHEVLRGPRLRDHVVLVGDPQYLRTFEGQVTWALLVNLAGRLYKGIRRLELAVQPDIERLPGVFFPNQEQSLYEASRRLLEQLCGGHMEIGEQVTAPDDTVIRVLVGGTRALAGDAITVAGKGWLAFLNDDSWKLLPESLNPIGPAVAACFAAAEIYRRLYVVDTRDAAVIFSAYDYSSNIAANPALPQQIHLARTYIAGAGAVGMALWVLLSSVRAIKSSDEVFVVDHDVLDDTNLNRCILAVLGDEGKKKVEIIQRSAVGTALTLKTSDRMWQVFVKDADPRDFERVLSCVDKYEARMAVQYGKMPRLLFTAGTSDFLLSVSRHVLSDGLACGLCYQARDPELGCAVVSTGAQQAFETPVDPSIGFVSLLAGVMLGAEYLKELIPDFHGARVQNTARVTVGVIASGVRSKVIRRTKDPNCNCSSEFVDAGYRSVWGDT